MGNKRDLKAYVRYDGSGRVIPGALLLQRFKPKSGGKWHEIDAYECCNSAPVLALRLLFSNISEVDAVVGDSSNVTDWNTYFDLPTYGSPFTSVEVVGNEVRLFGGSNIIIKESLFDQPDELGIYLLEVDDTGSVIELEYDAFGYDNNNGCTNLALVNFPNLIIVGDSAFYYAESLTSINIPLLETAGAYSFSSIPCLNFNFPNLTQTGNYCFAYNNYDVVTYTLPSLEIAGEGCFSYNDEISLNLTSLVNAGAECFSNSLIVSISIPLITNLEYGAFQNCTNLITVNAPLVSTTNVATFSGCTSLVSINLPLLTTIASSDFSNCHSLTSINFNFSAITTIESFAFYQCYALTSVSFPNVTTISSNAFEICTSLTSVNIPLVTTISSYAFSVCTVLNSITLANVTTIGERAFLNCLSLPNISLPSCLTIGDFCFAFIPLTTFSIPVCTNLGSTVGNDGVFYAISGRTITLTLPSALMTCNAGNPDGDVNDLTTDNTVTVVTV